jgi:hypothetical protein
MVNLRNLDIIISEQGSDRAIRLPALLVDFADCGTQQIALRDVALEGWGNSVLEAMRDLRERVIDICENNNYSHLPIRQNRVSQGEPSGMVLGLTVLHPEKFTRLLAFWTGWNNGTLCDNGMKINGN